MNNVRVKAMVKVCTWDEILNPKGKIELLYNDGRPDPQEEFRVEYRKLVNEVHMIEKGFFVDYAGDFTIDDIIKKLKQTHCCSLNMVSRVDYGTSTPIDVRFSLAYADSVRWQDSMMDVPIPKGFSLKKVLVLFNVKNSTGTRITHDNLKKTVASILRGNHAHCYKNGKCVVPRNIRIQGQWSRDLGQWQSQQREDKESKRPLEKKMMEKVKREKLGKFYRAFWVVYRAYQQPTTVRHRDAMCVGLVRESKTYLIDNSITLAWRSDVGITEEQICRMDDTEMVDWWKVYVTGLTTKALQGLDKVEYGKL